MISQSAKSHSAALTLVLGIFFVNCYKNMQSHPDEDDDSDEESGLKQNNIAKDNDSET